MIRQIAVLLFFVIVSLARLSASTLPIYINNSPVHVVSPPQTAPQIDATAFVNRSEFEINDIYFTQLPYQTFNTRFFTNTSSGIMSGDEGYRFEFSSGNVRAPMDSWINQGTIGGDTFLLISSTNVTSTGPLTTSGAGLLRITGRNINLTGAALRAGAVNSSSSGFTGTTNYSDPTGVSDLYWGAGSNNVLSGQANAMRLDQGRFDLNSGNFGSPPHQVVDRFNFTNTVSVPSFSGFNSSFGSGFGFGAYAFTNQTSATSFVVQVVFVRTNSVDTNLAVQVGFIRDFADGGAFATVEFSYPEFDVVSRSFSTNYLYFGDNSAFVTNISLSKNITAPTQRPNTYAMERAQTQFFIGETNNVTYNPSLLYNPAYLSNAVSVLYGGYAALVSPITVTNGSGLNIYTSVEPTNYPGRIEVNGDAVNLNQARIRAESTLIIRATDLSNNKIAKFSAPYSVFDLTSHQPQMVISNFAAQSVQRLNGQLFAWTGIWQNTEVTSSSTNQIQFHVLIVDHTLSSALPAVIYQLALHAPHLVIADPIAVSKSMILDARSMDLTGSLTLPSGANWANTNVIELYSFTNHGVITVSQTAFAGTDRANPYDNYVNIGTNSAATHLIRTKNLDDSGSLIASSGLISVEADTIRIAGPPPITNVITVFDFTNFVSTTITNVIGANLQSASDIQIFAGDLTLSNGVFQTGANGVLSLSVTNRLTDGGPTSLSFWNVGGGFQLLTAPATGDLFGTYVRSTIPRNIEVSHTWCAEDRGATPSGYSNNAAIGKLTLDAGEFSVIHFSAPDPTTQKALYVDYLELLNSATNFNSQLEIDPSLTIYFANANLSATKLDGAANGRLRWVKAFTGPLSSANFTYATTNLDGEVVLNNYTFNAALVTSQNLDSDKDGVVNSIDPTPIYTGASTGLKVSRTKGLPPQVLIQWNALAGATNTIEYRTSLTDPAWTVLTNIVPAGPRSGLVTVRDFVSNSTTGAVQRIYRVVVLPPP